ncbi:MAG: Lrp/AsnC family transcriptional regulator [Corynebacterium sp.]|nr:Lrp/AsnC family transcriptional regulator [Corynebacterium sp.]
MDSIDLAIIAQLKENGRMSNQDLAQAVGLTPAPTMRRIRKLEEDGIITKYQAVLNDEALGKGFEVLLLANLSVNNRSTVDRFERQLVAMQEVVEVRRMFSQPDYVIRVRVSDALAYENWLVDHFMPLPGITRVDSHMTMKVLKD